MVEGLIGKKVGMTQTFDQQGNVIPVTIIKVGPCTVIQKKTREKDGYMALQLCLVEDKKKKKPNKPLTGHYSKSGLPPARISREFRFAEKEEVKEGDQFFVDIFQAGEKVDVVGTSKGKGFAGVMKRWGYHGGKASHGSMFHRAPGSIGASAFPSRVFKGKKLPGHMGNRRITAKNLIVVEADKENNLLAVKGAVPGARGGYVLVKKTNFDPESYKPEPKPKPQPEPEKAEPKEAESEKPDSKSKEAQAEKKEAKAKKETEKPESEPEPEQPQAEQVEAESSKETKKEK